MQKGIMPSSVNVIAGSCAGRQVGRAAELQGSLGSVEQRQCKEAAEQVRFGEQDDLEGFFQGLERERKVVQICTGLWSFQCHGASRWCMVAKAPFFFLLEVCQVDYDTSPRVDGVQGRTFLEDIIEEYIGTSN